MWAVDKKGPAAYKSKTRSLNQQSDYLMYDGSNTGSVNLLAQPSTLTTNTVYYTAANL